MKITGPAIYQALQANPQGLSSKELLKALGQPLAKKSSLKKELKKLSAKRQVVKRNARYFSTGEPLTLTRKESRLEGLRKKRQPPQGVLRNRGIVVLEEGQLRVLPFGEQQSLPLAKQAGQGDWFPSDEVGFEIKGEQAHITQVVGRRLEMIEATLAVEDGKVWASPLNPAFGQRHFVSNLPVDPKLHGLKALVDVQLLPMGPVRCRKVLKRTSLDELYAPIFEDFKVRLTYPYAALEEARQFPQEVGFEPKSGRHDLRAMAFVTIDGADAKDFDDAIFAQREGENYRIWVSIADVADYVTLGSALDKEASLRSTSVYLPGHVVPMLPEELSNELCSLKEGKNRKTLTAEILLDAQGHDLEFDLYESIIQVRKRLTYPEVDELLEGRSGSIPPEVIPMLQLAAEIAGILTQKRHQRGTVGFSLPDTYFEFDSQRNLVDVRKVFQTPAQKLIEEFMLEANEQVGFYVERQKLKLLWRNHAAPLPEKKKELKEMLWNEGIRIKQIESGKDYNLILEQIKDSEKRQQIEFSLLRSMALAVYEANREGHFGLAATHYLHFTSPIRRYPDLVVHRSIKSLLHGKPPYAPPKWLGEHCSDQERAAQKAERAASKLQRALLMAGHLGEVFTVTVTGVMGAGVFVEVDSPYAEGFVPYQSMLEDRYQVNEEQQRAYGKRTKRSISLGSRLGVLLSGLDLERNSLNFQWIYFEEEA